MESCGERSSVEHTEIHLLGEDGMNTVFSAVNPMVEMNTRGSDDISISVSCEVNRELTRGKVSPFDCVVRLERCKYERMRVDAAAAGCSGVIGTTARLSNSLSSTSTCDASKTDDVNSIVDIEFGGDRIPCLRSDLNDAFGCDDETSQTSINGNDKDLFLHTVTNSSTMRLTASNSGTCDEQLSTSSETLMERKRIHQVKSTKMTICHGECAHYMFIMLFHLSLSHVNCTLSDRVRF